MYQLPLPPLSTNSGYHTRSGRWYKDDKIKDWEAECLWLLKGKKIKLLAESVSVHISFYFNNKRRNDIDGRIKFVLDMLQKAGFYKDDTQVTHLVVTKYLSAKSYMEIVCE